MAAFTKLRPWRRRRAAAVNRHTLRALTGQAAALCVLVAVAAVAHVVLVPISVCANAVRAIDKHIAEKGNTR